MFLFSPSARRSDVTLMSSMLVVVVCLAFTALASTISQNETALKRQILTDYDKTVRPSTPTQVTISLVVFSLNELNIEKQEMYISGVLNTLWKDPRLAWNLEDFAPISSIMVDYDTAWRPLLLIENSVEVMRAVGAVEKPPARIYYFGGIKWMVPINVGVFCEMTILAFPFDMQHCQISIYGWGYDTRYELNLTVGEDAVVTDFYSENGEWDLVGSSVRRVMITDGAEIFGKVIIQLDFKRKWVFHSLSMIVPAMLNSMLMCAVFALPFESGEKMGYSLTVLLTYIVLLTLVADSLPPVSTDTSALQLYLTGVMCTGTVATLLTVWTVAIYNQNPQKPLPPAIRYLCQSIIRPLLCLKKTSSPPDYNRENPTGGKRANKSITEDQLNPNSFFDIHSTRSQNSDRMLNHDRRQHKIALRYNGGLGRPISANQNVHSGYKHNQNGVPEQSRDENEAVQEGLSMTWKQVAETMDALFLRIVTSIIIAGSLALIIFYCIKYNE